MIASPDPVLIDAITKATLEAFRQAQITLPPDVIIALKNARARETSEIARGELSNIIANLDMAGTLNLPICQDTGVPIVYVTIPPDIPFTRDIYDAISAGVRQATREIPLRPNVVDPLTRENSGDNTGAGMPAIHAKPGDRCSITVLPKGAGAENMSRIAMLLPSERDQIPKFVTETMLLAGGRPCPPVILGVGIGSTFDGVATLAKEALLDPIDCMTPFEEELLAIVNSLGIGPMGLGGNTTALAVKVRTGGCHTASLPVAVNVQCWACRRATVEVVY